MHSSSAPRAPHHTLAYYVSTRGWALMQYGIMKYNTLQHGADRAGRAQARGWACRGRRQGQANKAGRGSASAASQTSSRRQDLAPASSSGGTHDRRARRRQTGTRDPCLPLSQEPGDLGTVSGVWRLLEGGGAGVGIGVVT